MLKYAAEQIKAPTLQTIVHKQWKAWKESHVWIAQWEDQQHQVTEPLVRMVWTAVAWVPDHAGLAFQIKQLRKLRNRLTSNTTSMQYHDISCLYKWVFLPFHKIC